MRLDRLNEMEQYILTQGAVSLETLSGRFATSLITVRRDLAELEKRGTVRRVYGGAASVKTESPVPSDLRAQLNRREKEQIGALAASLIADNETVFIDSGSTTVHVIRHLAAKHNVTIVTHSLTALLEAAKYKSLSVIAIGGSFLRSTASYVGTSAQASLCEMNVKTAIMGTTGISIENGLSNSTLFEADIKRCAVEHSGRILLAADHDKFGRDALLTFCPLSRLSTVVTDRRPEARFCDYFNAHGIRLLCE